MSCTNTARGSYGLRERQCFRDTHARHVRQPCTPRAPLITSGAGPLLRELLTASGDSVHISAARMQRQHLAVASARHRCQSHAHALAPNRFMQPESEQHSMCGSTLLPRYNVACTCRVRTSFRVNTSSMEPCLPCKHLLPHRDVLLLLSRSCIRIHRTPRREGTIVAIPFHS
jgi:hypothetical protein